MALNPKYKQADLEDRLATFTFTNKFRIPIVLQVMDWSGLETRKGVRKLTKDEAYSELHMVTRRSIANPGETFTFHIVLRTPVSKLPRGTYYSLAIGAGANGRALLEINCEITKE